MTLRDSHLIATYATLTLGTTALWFAEPEGTPPYPILALIAAIAAYFYTDQRRSLQLSRLLSNGIAIVILAALVFEVRAEISIVLTSLAHLLVYLQIAKYFRVKGDFDFAQLHVMNLLQVAIATVLQRQMVFAAVILVYAPMATATVALWLWWRHEEAVASAARTGSVRDAEAPRIRPIAAGFAIRLVLVTVLAAPFATGMFLALPRLQGRDNAANLRVKGVSRLRTGFAEKVSLDQSGRVIETDDLVLAVKVKGDDGKGGALPAEFLWRGSVLITYRNREWWSATPDIQARISPIPSTRPRRDDLLDLDVDQFGLASSTIFVPRDAAWVGRDDNRERFVRLELDDRIRSLGPTLPYRSRGATRRYQLLVDPKRLREVDLPDPYPSSAYLSRAMVLPPNLDRVTDLARRLVADLPPDDVEGRIERLSRHLSSSGLYGYSLTLESAATNEDPIESFLFRSRAGHCEYFASALAIMLRAAGVPSRLITGYKGVVWEPRAKSYQVRQWMAHSWVEAYIPGKGVWRTIDSTPTGEIEAQPYFADSGASFRRFFGVELQTVFEYLVDFTHEQQRDLATAAAKWWRNYWRVLATAIVGLTAATIGSFWLSRRLGRGATYSRFRPYRRLRRWSQRRGVAPLAGETPREFAERLAGAGSDVAAVAKAIVDALYEDRFGGKPLPRGEARLLERRLAALPRAIDRSLMAPTA